MFLSFDTNVSMIMPNDTLVFSAILTDPDGIDDVIGGSLVDPVGGDTYGTFATAATEGAYSLALTWNAMNAVRAFESDVGGSPRAFRAEFFDQGGHKSTQEISVTVTCEDEISILCQAAMTAGYECLPILCEGQCEDARDPNHCGGCRITCPMGQTCGIIEGQCVPD